MNPNQLDKKNNPSAKPYRVLCNPHAPRAKKSRQATPNPHNTATAEEPTLTNNPTPDNDNNPTQNDDNASTPTPTEVANYQDQNCTGMGTQSQFCKATAKQNVKAPKHQAKYYLPSQNLNDCLQCFNRLKSWKMHKCRKEERTQLGGSK